MEHLIISSNLLGLYNDVDKFYIRQEDDYGGMS